MAEKLIQLLVTEDELRRLAQYALAYNKNKKSGGGFQSLCKDILRRSLE